MPPAEAARILELPETATPEQVEARFHELRAKLEEKIVKAPTPGLKAKYRESLDEITAAFEALTLAADSSALPVLKKEAGDRRPEAGAAATQPRASDSGLPSPASGLPPAKRAKSGGMEFAIVAVIAVAVLGAGGWWVMKTRAENAEKARIAAEVKAAADAKAAAEKAEVERKVAEENSNAEAGRKEKLEEQERLARADKAKEEQVDRLLIQLRSELAAAKVAWAAWEREEQLAERRLDELRSDLRSLRDAPAGQQAELGAQISAQRAYQEWLGSTLLRHPAKVLLSQAEEILAARQADLASTTVAELKTALAALESEVPSQRTRLLKIEGDLLLDTAADAEWTVTDAFARTRRGRGPGRIEGLAAGPVTIEIARPFWPKRKESAVIRSVEETRLTVAFVGGTLHLTSAPYPVSYVLEGQGRRETGRTPAHWPELSPGNYRITYRREGWPEQSETVALREGENIRHAARFAASASLRVETQPRGATVMLAGREAGVTPLTLTELPPGQIAVELILADHRPQTLTGTLESGQELTLAASLRSANPDKQEVFDRFSREAAGVWQIPGAPVKSYYKFTAGDADFQWRAGFNKGRGRMMNYEDFGDVILVQFLALGRPVGQTVRFQLKDGKLHKSLAESPAPVECTRVPDSEW